MNIFLTGSTGLIGNEILKTTGKLIKSNLPDVKKICVICDNKINKTILKKLISSLTRYEVKIFKLSVSEKTKTLK